MKDNKIIAEFMGLTEPFELPQFGTIRPDGEFKTEFNTHQLKYHTSWDWLMLVVDKIENTNLFPTTENAVNVTIGATLYCVIQDSYGEELEIVGQDKTKLLSVYQAVVEFINEYNKTK